MKIEHSEALLKAARVLADSYTQDYDGTRVVDHAAMLKLEDVIRLIDADNRGAQL